MRIQSDRMAEHSLSADRADWPVLVSVLGGFQLLRAGCPVAGRAGGKLETLLTGLALRYEGGLSRDVLIERLWPDSDPVLAGQVLHSLVHSASTLLGAALGGAAPILHDHGGYRLNAPAGVAVDVACFEALARDGERLARAGDAAAAAAAFERAVRLYRGDLQAGSDLHLAMERERLRARHLTLLARLADYYYGAGDHGACLDRALRLLVSEPCREDAHRLAMRCYVRGGERAQALRQYRLCEHALRVEFDAAPEPATTELFDRIRHDPSGI